MSAIAMTSPTKPTSAARTVEGIARVVRVEGKVAWLEPEQTTSCGSCASKAACGHGDSDGESGMGTVARRIEARRFQMDNDWEQLRVGERVVLGVDNRSLIKAAVLAYALPLVSAILAGGLAQGAWGDDALTMASMAGGLGFGLLAARLGARRLSKGGHLSPRFLRRALPGETCKD
ncbi:MAG TPA: SoxR reducing system RseC family protein [Rhodocyclaceae bacterium]|nr:SoxR reducing system RseC family protein [Rhodocyclaceae bacterium]